MQETRSVGRVFVAGGGYQCEGGYHSTATQRVCILIQAGIAAVILVAFTVSLMAQGTANGTLSSLVTDAMGGVLLSVNVLVTNAAAHLQYPTVTNTTGDFTMGNRPKRTECCLCASLPFRWSTDIDRWRNMVLLGGKSA
jgi:hypothetical protein